MKTLIELDIQIEARDLTEEMSIVDIHGAGWAIKELMFVRRYGSDSLVSITFEDDVDGVKHLSLRGSDRLTIRRRA